MVVAVDNKERSKASARSLTTIVDFAVGSHARAVAMLLVVALLGFLPGLFSIPPIDRDHHVPCPVRRASRLTRYHQPCPTAMANSRDQVRPRRLERA